MNTTRGKPNIVFILSDDQGAWALGCAGNPDVRTPHLDRLAASGVRCENFFCTSPVCSPARASLFTGKIPSQHGVHDWIAAGNMGEDAIEYLSGQTAFTDVLADNGYTCGMSGKWHLGKSEQPQKSFKHWFVHERGGGPYYGAPMIRDGERVTEDGYITDVITNDGIDFIRAHADQNEPFYLSVHYTAPHDPWIGQHPQHLVDSYADCEFSSTPQEETHPWSIPNAPGADHPRESLQGYYASITAMDDNIGRILDTLEETGVRDNTLVIFLSDNGFNCGHHGIWGKGNGTYPQNMYDTSVKVPAIWSQPGRIAAGVVTDELISGYDVMPTLLDYTGFAYYVPDDLPGESMVPILEGRTTGGRDQVVIYDEYGPVRMIRTKRWKYVHRYPDGPHELYDLQHDPSESANKIADAQYEPLVEKMRAQMEQWFDTYAEPEMVGVDQPVTGLGQTGVVGQKNYSKQVFNQYD